MRGIAIALVVALHLFGFQARSGAEHLVVALLAPGWVGVDLFFVLSGFLITGLLADARGTRGYFRRFYVRRVLRIMPLYYVVLAATWWLLPALVPAQAPAYRAIAGGPWLWTFTINAYAALDVRPAIPGVIVTLWSLAIEEQFYLLWPVVVLALSPRTVRRLAAALLALSVVARAVALLAGVDPHATYVLPLTRFDSLAVGAWLALACRDGAVWPRVAARVAPLAAASSVRLAFVALLGWGALLALGASPFTPAMQLVGLPAIAAGGGLLLAASIEAPVGTPLARWMRARPLRMLGKYSYAIYLLHPIVGAAIYEAGFRPDATGRHGVAEFGGELAFVVVAGAVTLALAWLSWRVLENPCLRLKDRLAPREDGTIASSLSLAGIHGTNLGIAP